MKPSCAIWGSINVRNQVANVPGASVPQPFGGKYRQIQVYVDPVKLQANQLSVMDVVRVVNESNMILPAGDVRIGPKDYNLYTNSQLPEYGGDQPAAAEDGGQRLGDGWRCRPRHGRTADSDQHRARGWAEVGLPAGTETGWRQQHHRHCGRLQESLEDLVDVPKSLVAKVVFDQSVYVKTAIKNLGNEGAHRTGAHRPDDPDLSRQRARDDRRFCCRFRSPRWPPSWQSIWAAAPINTMVLGGLALVFSRLIDNSVVVLENIFRHLEEGEIAGGGSGKRRSRDGRCRCWRQPLPRPSCSFRWCFCTASAGFCLPRWRRRWCSALFASYMVAMTVVPLFCARFIKGHGSVAHHGTKIEIRTAGYRFQSQIRPNADALRHRRG